jgi:hypothetical protein
MLSAREAAQEVGMTKAGIIRSIHTGKLSATRNDNGQFVIDPVELFRVFTPVSTGVNSNGKIDGHEPDHQSEAWRQQLTLLERIIRDKEEVITDLRARLDASGAQVAQLTAVVATLTPPKAQKGWWARLLGGG